MQPVYFSVFLYSYLLQCEIRPGPFWTKNNKKDLYGFRGKQSLLKLTIYEFRYDMMKYEKLILKTLKINNSLI